MPYIPLVYETCYDQNIENGSGWVGKHPDCNFSQCIKLMPASAKPCLPVQCKVDTQCNAAGGRYTVQCNARQIRNAMQWEVDTQCRLKLITTFSQPSIARFKL